MMPVYMWQLLRLTVLVAGVRALHDASQPPPAPTRSEYGPPCNVTISLETSTLALSEPEPSPRRRERREPDEAAEFMELPPQLRRQLIRYGARWTEAVFEPKS